MRDAIMQLIANDLHGDARLGADVGIAMRMLRADVMRGNCGLPPWLTAHLDSCEKCGGEKVYYHKPFDGEWSGPFEKSVCKSGQGWHGCTNCGGKPS